MASESIKQIRKGLYMKEIWESKIVGLGCLALLEAVSDGIINGWGWRQWAIALIGVTTIVVRAFFTDTSILLPGDEI